MKSLPTLIKLAHQRVNNQRLRLAGFEEKNAALEQKMAVLQGNLKFEADRARTDPMLTLHYGRYAQGVERQMAKLKAEHADNLMRLKREQDRLVLLFKDQKVLEVYQDQQHEKKAHEQDARQQRHMDELAARLKRPADG